MAGGFGFQPFLEFVWHPGSRAVVVVLRHDVDRLLCNGLKMAQLDRDLRVAGSYCFRVVRPGGEIRL